jgi:predicted DNA-binding transcriptional regulator AlpA
MQTDTTVPTWPAGEALLGSGQLGTRRSAFYKLVANDGFPVPVQYVDGGDLHWWSHEVLAWLETRRRPARASDAIEPPSSTTLVSAPPRRPSTKDTVPTVAPPEFVTAGRRVR